jgi:hypothetical protein
VLAIDLALRLLQRRQQAASNIENCRSH